jgi:hypothetical protein
MTETELEELPGDNRPPVYWDEDGFMFIRASAIGNSCLFELVAAGQGYPAGNLPANMVRAFGEGHDLEPKVLEMLEHLGWIITDRQIEGELILPGKTIIRFHPDGIGTAPNYSGRIVIEVKALSDALWQRVIRHGLAWWEEVDGQKVLKSVIDEYPWQAASMSHGFRLPLMWVCYNKGFPPDQVTGEKPYCKDEGKLFMQYVDQPFISRDELVAKAQKIRTLVEGDDILDNDMVCTDPSHFPCRYLHLRPEPEGEALESNVAVRTTDVDPALIDELTQQLRTFKSTMDEAKGKYEAARDRLIQLGGDKKGVLLTENWKVPIYESSNTVLAWDEMTQEHAEIVRSYQRKKTYRYISNVKRLDGGNG